MKSRCRFSAVIFLFIEALRMEKEMIYLDYKE